MDRPSCCAALALILMTIAGAPALAGPAPASTPPSRPPNPPLQAIVAGRSEPDAGSYLYARRTRRLAQSYLRLKLLELREADLERARAVIERRLSPDALLAPALPSARPVLPASASGRSL